MTVEASIAISASTPGGYFGNKAKEVAVDGDVLSYKVTGTVVDGDENEYAYTFEDFSHQVDGKKYSSLQKLLSSIGGKFQGECTLSVEVGSTPWGYSGGGGGGGSAPAAAAAAAPAAAGAAAPAKKEEKPKEEEVDALDGGMDMFGGSGGGGDY